MKTRRLILTGSILLAGALSVHPGDVRAANPAADHIREDAVKQQQLQGEASGLADQLDGMIAEYARNGLTGEDVDTVKALRASIQRMSQTEMQQVVTLLEKAQAAPDAGQAKKSVSDAYSAQKGILVQIKRLLAEHLRNQQALELSSQLSQLADRQAANLQNGIELGKWSGGKKPENFNVALQAHLDGQKSEEAAIADELRIVEGKIAEFAKTSENADLAARFQKGVEATKKLEPTADAAADALKAGQVFKAVAEEKGLRDAMRKIAHDVAPPQNQTEALRQAERQLEKLENEQKEIAAAAAKTQMAPDFNQWLAQNVAANAAKNGDKKFQRPVDQLRADKALQNEFENQKREKGAELAGMEDGQGDLANKADLAAQDLEKGAAAAAQALKGAQEKMQEARGAMAEKDAAGAMKNANEAAAALEAARAQVAQLAGDQARTADQKDKALQQLADAAKDLGRKEAAASVNPDKSQQAALAKQAQQLAQQAAADAPNAAGALQQAAADAQKAADAAQAGQAPQAAAAQLAAAQDLAKAAQQLAQQAQHAQQAEQQLAAAEKAEQSLTPIIEAEQALERDTAKAAALAKAKNDAPFAGQNAMQEAIQTRTATFKNNLAPDFIAALSALTDATIDMGAAKSELDKPAGQPADEAEKKALDDLYRALKLLEQKAELAQAEVNPDPQNPAAEAAAAQDAAKADAAVNQAMQQMQKGQMQQAAQQLAQAAAEAGQIAATPGANPQAQEAAQQAAQDLSQAAAQAAAQNGAQAQAAAQQGQQALAQAEAAMAQARAGLAEAGNEPAHEGNEQGPPHAGEHPGSHPGNHPGSHPGNHPGEHPGMPGTQAAQKYQPGGEEALQKSTRSVSAKPASYAGLPPRERAAIEQAQSEKYPEEYGPLVEQYMRNLAAESSSK